MTYAEKHDLLKRASMASVIVATGLVLFKFAAWWLSDSVSLLASLMDSVTDIAASGVNLIAVRYAMQEADDNHHYGHGKAESLSAVTQAMFIAGSSLFLIVSALPRLFRPSALNNDWIAIGVMLVSICMTLGLVLYQRHVLRQIDSQSMRADSLNYLNDLLTNSGVLIALILSGLFGLTIADPIFAILISLFMLRNVWQIIKDAISILMDEALPPEEMEKIRLAIASIEGAVGVHRLRARKLAHWRMIDMHLEFPDDISLFEAHRINDEVEIAIAAEFDGPCEIMIHLEPICVAHDDRYKLGAE